MRSPAGSCTAARSSRAERQARVRRHHDGPHLVRRLADVLAADDGNPATVAQTHEMDAGLRRLVEDTYRARGGKGDGLPGAAAVSGRGRVDLRFAVDNEGELYILTKSDGMIRKIVGAKAPTADDRTAAAGPGARAGQIKKPPAIHANRRIPSPSYAGVDRRREEGVRHVNCAACHGNMAQGAVKARHHHLDHRGAGRKAAAGSDR